LDYLEDFSMSWDIRDADEYGSLISKGFKEWSSREAARVLDYWLLAVDAFTESDCNPSELESKCGNLGEFASGGDMLCDWITSQGQDPQLLWEAMLSIEYQLDGDDIGGKAISRKFDRATLLFRWIFNTESTKEENGRDEAGKFKPGSCPKCDSTKTKVASTKARIRNLKCKDCEHAWKRKRYM